MIFIKRKGDRLIFLDNGYNAHAAAFCINREIENELPGCVGRLKARVKNGCLQIGKNGGPLKPYKWHALIERKEIPIMNLNLQTKGDEDE